MHTVDRQRRHITGCENIVDANYAQILVHWQTPEAVALRGELLREQVSAHPRGPHDRIGFDALAAYERHTMRVDALYRNAGPALDSKRFERLLDHRPRTVAHIGADMRRVVGQDRAQVRRTNAGASHGI